MSPKTASETDSLRSWAEIDLDALTANARVCARLAGKNPQLLAVIKANGYGHGIREVATTLAALEEVWGVGVANLAEAATIADAISERQRILILGPLLPTEREAAVQAGFSIEISDADEAQQWQKIAQRLSLPVAVHITIDTGMGRMGVLPKDFPLLLETVRHSTHLQLEGVATHLPSADEDAVFTAQQIAAFRKLVADVPSSVLLHVANSAGVMAFSESLDFTQLARPGLALYGVPPVAENASELAPVLSLKSRVTLVRKLPAGHGISYGCTFVTDRATIVATIGIGYGDGYPRSLSGKGADVLIAGERCPVLGRVTMDQIMVDVSHLDPRPSAGDEVVLIGGGIDAIEIATKANTIPWEILTNITQRVVRVYR